MLHHDSKNEALKPNNHISLRGHLVVWLQNVTSIQSMSGGDPKSVSKATLLKEEGTKYFKEKDLVIAVKYYTQVSGYYKSSCE